MKSDNLATYPDHRSNLKFYEAWYIKLNRRSDRSALWLRFSLLNSTESRQGLVHAVFFPKMAGQSIIRAKASYNLHDLEARFITNQGENIIQLGDNFLGDGHSRGHITNESEIYWDLKFKPNEDFSFHYAPPFLNKLISSQAGSPNVNTAISGSFMVNGTAFTCDKEPASQGHYSGKKYAKRWAWAHCNYFDDCGRAIVFEIIDVKISSILPSFKSAYIRYQDQNHVIHDFKNLFFAKSNYKAGQWHYRCQKMGLVFDIRIQAEPTRTVDITYNDVDNSKLICHNTKLAQSTLTVSEGTTIKDKFTSSGTTAFEIVERS